MEERLSSPTIPGTIAYVAGCRLLGGLYLFLNLPSFHGWGWALGLAWLLLGSLNAYELRLYQVTVTATNVQLRRLFSPPISYPLTDFVDLCPTTGFRRPLRISFTDGRSFRFQPKLKDSAFSFHYTPLADFTAWWHEELTERAAAQPAQA